MHLDESIHIFGDGFQIFFLENPGMAFGIELFGGEFWGKLILSLFRVFAVIGIFYYVRKLVRENAHRGFITAIALILAGAAGNIIDSAFYGLIFTESDPILRNVAEFVAPGNGYGQTQPLGGFLLGNVVDMLYFPLIEGRFPDWFPFWGGETFEFFRPVFNVADAAISIGVGMIIVRQKTYFADPKKSSDEESDDEPIHKSENEKQDDILEEIAPANQNASSEAKPEGNV